MGGTVKCGGVREDVEEVPNSVELSWDTRKQEPPVVQALPWVQGMWGRVTQAHIPCF